MTASGPETADLTEPVIRPIVQLGDPVLRQVARPIEPEELTGSQFRGLARDMLATLEASRGVGLAAPQVGVSARFLLAGSFPSSTAPDRPTISIIPIVNPVIVWRSEERDAMFEGCLSIANLRVRVERPIAIRVEGLNPRGEPMVLEAKGFLARVLQHEIDHLDGVLIIDHARGPEDLIADPPPGSNPRDGGAEETDQSSDGKNVDLSKSDHALPLTG